MEVVNPLTLPVSHRPPLAITGIHLIVHHSLDQAREALLWSRAALALPFPREAVGGGDVCNKQFQPSDTPDAAT